MLTIIDGASLARALKLPIDLQLKRLLIERRDQLGGDIAENARFVIMLPGDSLKALEDELGWSLFVTPEGYRFPDPRYYPPWEWLNFDGHIWELVHIYDDSGYAHVVFIINSPMQNRDLRALCLTYSGDYDAG